MLIEKKKTVFDVIIYIEGGQMKHTETSFPVGEPAGIFGLVAARVAAIEVAQVVDGVTFQR